MMCPGTYIPPKVVVIRPKSSRFGNNAKEPYYKEKIELIGLRIHKCLWKIISRTLLYILAICMDLADSEISIEKIKKNQET